MEITGPFLDSLKKKRQQCRCWYLRYSVPRKNPDGTVLLDANGKMVLQRLRPFYESKAKAEADIPNIRAQHETTGSGHFLFDRKAVEDYDAASKLVGGIPLVEVAKFWRLHHPDKPKRNLEALFCAYLEDIKARHGEGRHYSDLKSRGRAFLAAGFCNRYSDTVTRAEIMTYLREMPGVAPRTCRNHKVVICEFFNWIIQETQEITVNPAAGITRRMLPKEVKNEIGFLHLDEVKCYLRTLERYDPELVAHEVIQLFSGVRSDDEMANFEANFVLPQTREVVIPEAIAKTGKREVIGGLEENFWNWWATYGKGEGLLRPRNYGPRWNRVRYLSHVRDPATADELAKLPIKTLLARSDSAAAIAKWPWNARRRSFCTYHVAKYDSAEKTALILRHRGSSYTLHNSYRGLGVTKDQGREYFEIRPEPVAAPILPEVVLKGIVRIQAQARTLARNGSA